MVTTLRIHLLGDFQLFADGTPVTSFDLPRLQSLLAYLLLHRNVPQSRSHLAYLLWPDSTDAQAHTNLRNLIHKLRQAFPSIDSFLRSDRQTLTWLQASPQISWTLDVQEFEEALAQADGGGSASRRALELAVEKNRGDLLPNCYDEWILPERDRLRQALLGALNRLIELQEQERDYSMAIATAQRHLRYDPLQESTYRHLMRLYALIGDRAAAMRMYHTCASTLERDLGVEPSLATREAYDQLVKIETHVEAPQDIKMTPSSTQLVGRHNEWAQLQAAWRNASAGQSHVLLLSGEAGIGKTRLAEELLTWVERQGISTSTARCYAAQGGLAFAPVANWLRSEAIRPTLTALAA
jgi:DNA-binding SARP family transcriptional activator